MKISSEVLAGILAAALMSSAVAATPVQVPAHIDHQPFTALLARYVDARGLVDYAGWRDSGTDRAALRQYLAAFDRGGPRATGDDRSASLINAYNAFTLSLILDHFPVRSIRAIPDAWSAKRHAVDGQQVSLDEIEHDALRPLAGYRVHAALVCAARSCPPLRRAAFTAAGLDRELDDAMAAWLARDDLNRFVPAEHRVELSRIFDWYRADFEKAGGLKAVLGRFAPVRYRALFESEFRIGYLPYDWGLNDQGGLGREYGVAEKLRDQLRDLVR